MPEVNWRGQPAHFVGNVEWPTRADNDDEDATGTVIFGNQPEGGYFQISGLTVKVAEPLVEDVGEQVTLSTPKLGRNDHDEPPQIGGQVEGFAGQTEEQGLKDQARASSITARLTRSYWRTSIVPGTCPSAWRSGSTQRGPGTACRSAGVGKMRD